METDDLGWSTSNPVDEVKLVAMDSGSMLELVRAYKVASNKIEYSSAAHNTFATFCRFCNSGTACGLVTEAAAYQFMYI